MLRRLFTVLFSPVLRQLGRYSWLVEPGDDLPFIEEGLNDPGFEVVVGGLETFGGLWQHWPPDTVLPRFARYLTDGSIDLYGLSRPPADPEQFVRRRRAPGFVAAQVDVLFGNVDGAFWEFHGDPALADLVLTHLQELGGGVRFERRETV